MQLCKLWNSSKRNTFLDKRDRKSWDHFELQQLQAEQKQTEGGGCSLKLVASLILPCMQFFAAVK